MRILQEKKEAEIIELKKIELEILELDKELKEDEVVTKVVKKVVKEVVRDTELTIEEEEEVVVVEAAVTVNSTQPTIVVDKKAEIEEENRRRLKERETVIEILLFSVLNSDLSLEMKLDGNRNELEEGMIKEKEKDQNDIKMVTENRFVNFSVKKSKNTETGLQVQKNDKNSTKKKADPIVNLTTLILKSEKIIPPYDSSEKDSMGNNGIPDYFVIPESVLSESLVVAFEVQ